MGTVCSPWNACPSNSRLPPQSSGPPFLSIWQGFVTVTCRQKCPWLLISTPSTSPTPLRGRKSTETCPVESCLARSCRFHPRSFLEAGLAGGCMLAAQVVVNVLQQQDLGAYWPADPHSRLAEPEAPAYPRAIWTLKKKLHVALRFSLPSPQLWSVLSTVGVWQNSKLWCPLEEPVKEGLSCTGLPISQLPEGEWTCNHSHVETELELSSQEGGVSICPLCLALERRASANTATGLCLFGCMGPWRHRPRRSNT